MDSFELQDELQAVQDLDSYEINHDHDFSTEEPEQLLEAVVELVAENSNAICEPEVFDAYRCLLKYSENVSGAVMSKLLDSISSGLQAELEATMRDIDTGDQQTYISHKMPLEIYAFLLNWFLTAAEKVKAPENSGEPTGAKGKKGKAGKGVGGRGAANKKADTVWSWQDQVEPTLALIARVLSLQSQRLWTTTAERDTFISCITRPAYYATESEQCMKVQSIKMEAFKVICRAVKNHGQTMAVQITIMQSLQFYEHLSEPFAECLAILHNQFDYSQLGDEILREIAGKAFGSQDNKGPKSFARFLTEYAERCPRLVLKQLSLLQDQLESEAYPMRQAIIEIIGVIICELSNNNDPDNTDGSATAHKQIKGLFSLLVQRTMDISSFVRIKVFTVFAKLTATVRAKIPRQRLQMTTAAVSALDDKTATVRKSAIHLLIKLLETHPYGQIAGGKLQREKCITDYNEIVAQLAKIEGVIGKVVNPGGGDDENGQQEEGETQKDGDDEHDNEDGESSVEKKTKKRSKNSRAEDQNSMDIDQEPEAGGDTEEDKPSEMSVDEDGDGATPKSKKKGSKLKPRKSQLDVNALNEEQAVLANYDHVLLQQLGIRKKFYVDALNFVDQIESAMDPLCGLLGSKSKPEVLEIMDFFRTASEYGFESASEGVKKMLHLIWSKDNNVTSEDGKELKGIRQRLLECYRSLYFDPVADLEPKHQVGRIAKNLIGQTYEATLAELTSLEEMMRVMMEEGHIHQDVIAKLWQVYGSKNHLPKPQRRGAIIILGMLALSKRSVLTDKVEVLLNTGLGPNGKVDPTLARYTCIALQRLNGSAKKVKGSLVDKTQRIEMDNKIFRKLQNAILHPSRTKEWFGMAEQIINTVYALGEHPDVFCNEVIRKLTLKAFGRPRKYDNDQSANSEPTTAEDEHAGDVTIDLGDVNMQDATQPSSSQCAGDRYVGEAFELSQLIFIVGHVAIKHIVFLELVEREWKRQKDEKHAAERQAAAGKNGSKDGDELDQVAGNAEDDIGDRIAAVRESELLYGPNSLLAMYGPMIVQIAGSPNIYKSPILRATASLAFSKFLCVSSQFCDQHHRLLFKILETSKDLNIRSNIIIALGDVAVSFSTIIDENSNELYKGLSDTDFVVKKNTLMVLTHLILNGMIKVKGQLGEMAKCVEDPEPRIADLAKLFFTDLSTKENAIYNNLPDVISHLSTGEHAVEEKVFQDTLKYIFGFIEKEKQAESIVEKLCQRFRLSEDPRQWRDIAFCLSLLPFKSERSVKKLIEGLQFYRDKLHEPIVFARFCEILTKARTNKSKDKPDSELNEFEQILEEHRAQGQEDQALEKRVEGKKAAAKKRATRKTTRSKKAAAPPDDDMYSD